MTQWSLDTCGCILNMNPDFTFNSIVNKCAVHSSVADADLFNVIYGGTAGENKRKNQVEGMLISTTQLGLGELNADGYYVWKSGYYFTWEWSGTGASRVLTITVTGTTLTTQQRNTAQTWCNTQFRSGKVVIA